MLGGFSFTASESFDAILGSSTGQIYGGGVHIDPHMGGLYFDAGAWRFHGTGERVFVFDGEVFPLGIPVDVKVTPIEVSAGWRFRVRRLPNLIPYAAGGITSVRYREESDFATDLENDDKTFNGAHAIGGVEYKVTRWFGVAGEFTWTTVPDAIGKDGVSKIFGDTDLGGASLRFKITIGR